ncbi:MAG: UdgX family uracil-DNA binding protein [Desulfovibrionales bacterium]
MPAADKTRDCVYALPMKSTREREQQLGKVRNAASSCRRCGLWENATQTVFGQGPAAADMMLVGEQPGDQEDKQGVPFVGPAGGRLDRALERAGLSRRHVYITNAVKHFKWDPRGAKRQHRAPDLGEITACRHWLEQEIELIRPGLIVAMGTTAARSVFGKATPVNKNRGLFFPLTREVFAAVTVHPSSLLRIPDQKARHEQFDRFVQDFSTFKKFLSNLRDPKHPAPDRLVETEQD